MKETSKTIIFFGNERLATGVTTNAPTLRALVSAGYNVAAVVSSFERGVSRKSRHLEIAQVADEYEIPVLLPKRLSDISDKLAKLGADLGVLAAYGKMVPESIIQLFPSGIVNIHPSLLPKHRGPSPIESVILDNDARTGVSIMKLVKAMDAGPIYGQAQVSLDGKESKQELTDSLLDIGQAMLVNLLPDILSGGVVSIPQDDSQATYDRLLTKDDGQINWRKPADQLEREVRAFLGWPKSRTQLANKEVIITSAHVVPANYSGASPGDVDISTGTLMVRCGQDYLCIDRLKPSGRQEMTGQAFLAGHKNFYRS